VPQRASVRQAGRQPPPQLVLPWKQPERSHPHSTQPPHLSRLCFPTDAFRVSALRNFFFSSLRAIINPCPCQPHLWLQCYVNTPQWGSLFAGRRCDGCGVNHWCEQIDTLTIQQHRYTQRNSKHSHIRSNFNLLATFQPHYHPGTLLIPRTIPHRT